MKKMDFKLVNDINKNYNFKINMYSDVIFIETVNRNWFVEHKQDCYLLHLQNTKHVKKHYHRQGQFNNLYQVFKYISNHEILGFRSLSSQNINMSKNTI
jgi:hypothetical protein